MKARAVSYGAAELKQLGNRYMAIGLTFSVAIHVCVIAGYVLRGLYFHDAGPLHPAGPTAFPRPDWREVFIVTPPPLPGDPYIPRGGSKHPGGKFAMPVPAPLSSSNDDSLLFEPGNPGPDPGPGDGTEGVDGGEGTGLVVAEEVPPEPFVPVEKEPVLIKKVNPAYPELAMRSGLEGKVWVKIWVDREGKAHRAGVTTSTSEIFNDAAIAAAMQFVFTPAYTTGGPVAVWVSIPFTFRIKE